MPPRMDSRVSMESLSDASSWRGRDTEAYSPFFGRLPVTAQPIVEVDSEGDSIVIEYRGRSTSTKQSYAEYRNLNSQDSFDYEDEANATVLSSVVALTKSILGIGLVSMPYVCSEVGYVNYGVLLAMFALPSHFANMCLAYATDLALGPPGGGAPSLVDKADYLTLGVLAFGSKAQWWILTLFLIVIWGGTISLLIALHDILISYVDGVPVLGSSAVLISLLAVCVFPFCCLDSLNALRHTSYLGIFGIAMVTVCLLYWGSHYDRPISDMAKNKFTSQGVALIPVLIFAYMGQFNFIRVYSELQKRSPRRVAVVSGVSLFVTYCFYFLTGFFGYWAFSYGTEQDVFNNLSNVTGVMTDTAKILFAVALIFTAPVYLFEARNMVEDMLEAYQVKKDGTTECLNPNAVPKVNMKRRVLVVAVLLSTMTVVAVAYPHVTQVLGLLGATTSTIMMVILPPLFYIRIAHFVNHPVSPLMKKVCLTFFASGTVCIPAFSALVIWTLIKPADAPPPIHY
eukprot:TRINITY_DN5446_c0_g1_i1.p1 TRINITY_DN5446_c0_g1~~TRINITY_DN5446_c0_g1_i1.p1  ORF type:complete len:512 (+),score=130.38 TRINITY_DN5446_c0_g1_i1:257-1792(+)